MARRRDGRYQRGAERDQTLSGLGWQMRPKGAAKTKSSIRPTSPAIVFARETATIGARIPCARRESQPNLIGAFEYSLEGRDQTSAPGSYP